MVTFKVTKKAREEKLAKLTPVQRRGLEDIEDYAILNFEGSFDELESALGMLRIGHHVGWKVLYIIHSKRTIRKYENILGVRVREIFPEVGPSSYRSLGFKIVERVSNFWKAISGEVEIKDRREITK